MRKYVVSHGMDTLELGEDAAAAKARKLIASFEGKRREKGVRNEWHCRVVESVVCAQVGLGQGE